MPLLKRGLGTALVLLAAAWATAQNAAVPPTEYQVKAAFLYNFAKFVEWPAAAGHEDTFGLAILGDDPFGEVIDRTLHGKTLSDRRLVIKRIASVDDLEGARILFISDSEKGRLPQILKRLQGVPVLTVGESDEFVARGGMVGFRTKDDVVRFDINLDQVNRAGLKMSSQLIRVARRVVSAEGGS